MESDHQPSSKMLHDWVIDVKKDLGEGPSDGDVGGSGRMPPICRVPAKVREMNVKSYQPEVVSIGPYHHGEERLKGMEMHKRRALLHFLRRTKQTPEVCLGLLRDILPEIMADYHNLDQKWKDNDGELFLKVMLMDGCFILEILLTCAGVVNDYARDDPIFGCYGQVYNVFSIRRDLLLIENQIPLLVLRKLTAEMKAKRIEDIDDDLHPLLSEFLQIENPGFHVVFSIRYIKDSRHILDLYRRILGGDLIIGVAAPADYMREESGLPKIPSAMELRDHGILLRKMTAPIIWFSRWRLLSNVLYLPRLTVDDTTECVVLNAMVFESLQRPASAKFTSYVSLMCNLIVSPKDASLLSTELGIIRNGLRSDQALVDLFSNLSSTNFLPDHWLFLLQKRIDECCGRRRNRFRAYLNRTYFRNPWAQISVFSAIVLFVLTAVQTFYAIFPNK